MGGMKDHAYGDRPVYPDAPGYRGRIGGPSQRAAVAVAGKAKTFASKIAAHLKTRPNGCTADEVAAGMDVAERYRVRPRLAEMHRRGEIVDTGLTRPGTSGIAQTVWAVAPSQGGDAA